MPYTTIIQDLQKKILFAKNNSPLALRQVTLLAASKGQPLPQIEQALAAGITDFGENRVQEAHTKWPGLKKHYPSIQLHLIGPLQSNKVRQALDLFDVIQTIDRPGLADEIARHALSRDKRFYIQVNIGKEPQKAGVMPEEADSLIQYCLKELTLPVVGLMCVPPVGHLPAPYFALLREIALRNGLDQLSMGMSDDYETAVRMGSTCVRVGRALFGEDSRKA